MCQKIWAGPSHHSPSFGQNLKEQLLFSGNLPLVSQLNDLSHLNWDICILHRRWRGCVNFELISSLLLRLSLVVQNHAISVKHIHHSITSKNCGIAHCNSYFLWWFLDRWIGWSQGIGLDMKWMPLLKCRWRTIFVSGLMEPPLFETNAQISIGDRSAVDQLISYMRYTEWFFWLVRPKSARPLGNSDTFLKGFTCNLTLSHFLGRTSKKNHPADG